ncbi:MAG TPA: AI-2E family transporter, partial [Chloroflexota bacterium]|nr:AI-2E family transporter [Chloroflexota bacterium]
PRGLAVLLIYLTLILLLVGLGVLVVPAMIDEVEQLALNAPQYSDLVLDRLRELREQYSFLPPLDEQLAEQLRGLTGQIGLIAAQALTVARVALSIFSGLLNAVLVLILTLYFVVFGQTIRAYLLSFVPPGRRPRLVEMTDRMGRRMGGWLLGQIVLSMSIGVVSYVGLSVLGVRYAIFLAVVAAIGEAIPNFGPILSTIPAVLVALTQSPLLALATLALYFGIQQLENNLLVPKIMERAVELHPFATILALLVGVELMGVIGAILSVPVTAALAVALDEVRWARGAAESAPAQAAGPLPAPPEPPAAADTTPRAGQPAESEL